MKISNHLKLAIITGFLLGLLMGTVDVIAKIIVWSFEWFEFYQTLFSSIIIVTILFFLLFIFLQLFMKITKIKFSFETLRTFYFSSAVSFALFFYLLVLINRIFLINHTFSDFLSIKLNLGDLALSIGIFVLILFKGKKLILKTIDFFSKKTTKKLLENYIFIVLVFILSSFLLDIYLINKTPSHISDKNVDGSPNILLIVLDTARADHLSPYGYPLNTSPNLNEFAKNSVVFDDVIAPSAWSLPSHTSLFTGRYGYNHGVSKVTQYVGNEETLLAEVLNQKGYVTSGIVASSYVKARYGFSQGMMSYDQRLNFFEYQNLYTTFDIRSIFIALFPDITEQLYSSDETSEEINRKVFKWLDKNKDQTFFLFISYNDLHHPYAFGKEFRTRFTNKSFDYSLVEEVVKINEKRRYEPVSDELLDYIISLYDSEAFYLDHNLGELFNKLDELGIKDNTLVIITSDHGEEFYEHGGFVHANTLYEESIHVPLIIYYPKQFTPKRVSQRVSLVDIFPTILEFSGINISKEDIDGVSLIPLLEEDAKFKRDKFIISEIFGRFGLGEASLRALYDGDWKIINANLSNSDYKLPSSLFNLKNDPNEFLNLYNSNTKERDRLLGYLESMKKNR